MTLLGPDCPIGAEHPEVPVAGDSPGTPNGTDGEDPSFRRNEEAFEHPDVAANPSSVVDCPVSPDSREPPRRRTVGRISRSDDNVPVRLCGDSPRVDPVSEAGVSADTPVCGIRSRERGPAVVSPRESDRRHLPVGAPCQVAPEPITRSSDTVPPGDGPVGA